MNVLIADDDALNVAILSKFFTARGIEVTTAYDGQEALEKFKQDHYVLVITDIVMPKVEGIEIIGEIRNQSNNIKIIAMSSDADAGRSSLLKIAETMGANLCLKKPISAEMLTEALESLGIHTL